LKAPHSSLLFICKLPSYVGHNSNGGNTSSPKGADMKTTDPAKYKCTCRTHHEAPHCLCRHNNPPRKQQTPVTVAPAVCQAQSFISLGQIAYAFYMRHNISITCAQVSGAIRHLDLKNVKDLVDTKVVGIVFFRQQTCVYEVAVRTCVLPYLEDRYLEKHAKRVKRGGSNA